MHRRLAIAARRPWSIVGETGGQRRANTTYRRLLGLPPHGAISASQLRDAYTASVKEAHPDHGGTPENFRAVRAAYEAMRNTLPEKDRVLVREFKSQSDIFADAVKRKDIDLSQSIWNDIVEHGDITAKDFNVYLEFAAINEETLASLEDLISRKNIAASVASDLYNSWLHKVNALREDEATMDLILKSLASMDRQSIQPDLAICEDLFTFFPKRG